MKKWAAALCLTSCLALFSPRVWAERGTSATEESAMASFGNPERLPKFFYPEGWSIQELKDQHPYQILATPGPADPQKIEQEPIAATLSKFYHASATVGEGPSAPEALLDRYSDGYLALARGKILEKQTVDLQGTPARLVLIEGTDSNGQTHDLILLTSVLDDVLVSLSCEAPKEKFDEYRPVFEEMARRLEPFPAASEIPDNTRMDQQSSFLADEAMTALRSGDTPGAIDRLEQAIRLNPGSPEARLNYGNVLYSLSQKIDRKERQKMVQQAQQELELTKKIIEAKEAPERNLVLLGQTYFLFGEIAFYEKKDKKEAKAMYEEALKCWPHPQAKEGLKRCGPA